jgi:hypothetical protein
VVSFYNGVKSILWVKVEGGILFERIKKQYLYFKNALESVTNKNYKFHIGSDYRLWYKHNLHFVFV